MSDMLKSHGEDAPSGENLEYDPDFIAMELAAQPEEERQAGSEIVEGSDPDYKDLANKARVILERSHDIRAAVYLADSELRLNGLSGFAEITTYIRGCLEQYWDTCHPQLDEEDDNDPMMRINVVSGLAGRTTILRGLRSAAPLTNSRVMGRITLRDFDILNGDVEPSEDETPKSSSEIPQPRRRSISIERFTCSKSCVKAVSVISRSSRWASKLLLSIMLIRLSTFSCELRSYAERLNDRRILLSH